MPISIIGKTDLAFKRKHMYTIMILFGFGFGFEGIENGKLYVGVYTPQAEYGYVITRDDFYLDTILEKNPKKSS